MKWIVNKPFIGSSHEFQLVENGIVKEIVRYNPIQQSVRVLSKDKRRVFFIEKGGLFNNYTLFKNEYGVEIGRLLIDKWHLRGGTLKMDGRKYHYLIQDREIPEMVIFEHSVHHPLLTCQIAHLNEWVGDGDSDKSKTQLEYACLLLGLVWYLEVPGILEGNHLEPADHLALTGYIFPGLS
jgi:hypothetical protein